jgi:N-methylhydantoinase B
MLDHAPPDPIDPVTREVIGNALLSVCDEMSIVLSSTARSPVLRESGDYACTMHDRAGQLIAQTNTIPSLASIGRHAVLSLGKHVDITTEAGPGDVYFTNLMEIGGSHVSDVKAIMPVFHLGEIIAWVCNTAHWPEIGGAFPTGYVCGTEIYQEGLLIPPVRLVRSGRFDRETLAFVTSNVRAPEERVGDIRAQEAAVRRGGQRIIEMVERYGLEKFERYCAAYVDYTETRVRAAIREIPSGVYAFEDAMDNDGIGEERVGIKVAVTVDCDRMHFDFTGSSPQVRGPINSTEWTVWAGVNFAVRGVTDPTIPINEGCYRPLEVIVPAGTWLNAHHPAPRQHSSHETGHRVVDVCLGALAQAVPERVPAAMHGTSSIMIVTGQDERMNGREMYVLYEALAGGFGARPTKDGIDGIRTAVGNQNSIPAEVMEVEYPLVTEHYELVTDSGGCGRFRGGLALRREVRVAQPPTAEALFVSSCERTVTEPYGLAGGLPGKRGQREVVEASGRHIRLKGKDHRWQRGGDCFVATAPGGGGWGDPLAREPAAVLDDVLDGKVSLEAAEDDYGVVLDETGKAVDEAATQALRHTKRGAV